MLENEMKNLRMHFNVMVFDINSNRIRENLCTCENFYAHLFLVLKCIFTKRVSHAVDSLSVCKH